MAKNADSKYREGMRSPDWLKIKTHSRQEAVIGGFTEPRGSRKNLGRLVLGVYEGDDLVYIGHTGGGFGTQGLADLRERLDELGQRRCPFREPPHPNAPVHWVKPELVCEVRFGEWTKDGIMRQPIFLGLREDKPARDVHRERAETVAGAAQARACARRPPVTPSAERTRRRACREGPTVVHSPGQGLLARRRFHQGRPDRLLPHGRVRDAALPARPAAVAAPPPQRHRGDRLLSEEHEPARAAGLD